MLGVAAGVAAELDGSVKVANLLREALKGGRARPDVYGALTRVLLAAEKDEEALEVCREGLDRFPEADVLHLLKAQVLHGLDRDEEGLAVLWALAEGAPAWGEALAAIEGIQGPSARLYAVQGDRLQGEGDAPGALRAYDRAVGEDPRCVPALEGRARLFLGRGEEDAAYEALQEALTIDSTRATVWSMKATIEEARGDTDEAIRSLQVSVRYDSENVPTVRRLGTLLHDAGRDEEALECYMGAPEVAKEDIRYLEGSRRVLAALGRWEEFRAATRRLAELRPERVDLRVDEARSWTEVGETSRAMELLTHVLEGAPDPAALRRAGDLAIQAEAWELARRAGEGILQGNPGDRGGLRCLALALRGLHRDTEALKILSKGIRLYADLELLQAKRAILQSRADPRALFRCCEEILRITPEAVDVYREMATIAGGRGKTRVGLRVCERGLRRVPESLALRRKKADLLFQEGRFGDAYRVYDEILLADDENAPAWKGRGLSLHALKDYQGAAEALDRAARLDDDPESWYYRGLCLQATGELEEARGAFDRAVAGGGEGAWWLARGVCLRENEDPRDALYSFEQALEADPTLDLARLHRAECLLELDDPRAALRSLDDAPFAGNLGRDLLQTKIRCLEGLGEFQEAFEAAVTLTNRARGEGEAWMLRARLARALGLITQARLSWARAAKLVPEDPAPKVEEATMLLELEQPPEALRLCEEALALDRRNEGAALARAQALAALQNHEAALRAFDGALALHPGWREALQGRARSLVASGRFDDALRTMEELEAASPSDPGAYLWKARILGLGGRWEDALKCLNQALYYGGGAPEILAQKGIVLGEMNRVEEGLSLLQGALPPEKPHPALVSALATLLIRAERYERALESLPSAPAPGPEGRRFLQLRAEALGGLGRWDEAMDALSLAARAGPVPSETWVRLSALYETQGDGPAAVTCYDRALERDAGNVDLLKGRGRLCAQLGRWPEALASYEAAAEAAPEDEEAQCGLGKAFAEAGLFDEAQEAFRRALAANPASRRAAEGRQEVEERRHARSVEAFALRVLQFELTYGRPATKEEAFRYCDVPMELLPDVLAYVNEPPPLDVLSLAEGEIRDLEARSREVLFAHEGAGLPRLADVMHDIPEMPPSEARRVLEYIQGVVATDLPPEETPNLERLMKLAMELPEAERDTLLLARELGIGVHRAKMVNLALHRFQEGTSGGSSGGPGLPSANRCRKHGTAGIYQHLCGQYLCSTCIVGGRCPICRHPVSASLSQLTRGPEEDESGDARRY